MSFMKLCCRHYDVAEIYQNDKITTQKIVTYCIITRPLPLKNIYALFFFYRNVLYKNVEAKIC